MEFADLNDDIVADDWIIPSDEISKRRLIKQTPRYNVYKADWFGDVLVYEPNRKQDLATRRQQNVRQIDQHELNCRLNRLDLSSNLASPSTVSVFSFSDSSSLSDSEQTDSAYSSISSTPHYQTNNTMSEFNFPTRGSPTLNTTIIDDISRDDNNNNIYTPDMELMSESSTSEKQQQQVSKQASGSRNSMPVILNKESYKPCSQDRRNDSWDPQDQPMEHQSSWFELNELRLVAHEGFMLFMGASMDRQLEGTSLVMQMNHPKSVSLYHLLHNSNFTSSGPNSPVDSRLFNYNQRRLSQQLNNGAKLNICKQVMNAMTYLHDKNIVHGKLTSVNIYIELNQRVKISLIDEDERPIALQIANDSPGSKHNLISSVEFNLPSLTYLSPELIKTISVVNPTKSGCDNVVPAHVQFDSNQLTQASDVFSFGTLLFELFEERFPFAPPVHNNMTLSTPTSSSSKVSTVSSSPTSPKTCPTQTTSSHWNGNIKVSANQLIYQIGSGQIECKNLRSLDKLKSPALVEHIIEKCWSLEPSMRPQFKQLASALY